MLNYLAVLSEWASEQQKDPACPVQLKLKIGPADRPKRSADVGFETDAALGVVAVWETDEAEAEVLVVESMTRPFVESRVLQSEDELRDLLARVMSVIIEQ